MRLPQQYLWLLLVVVGLQLHVTNAQFNITDATAKVDDDDDNKNDDDDSVVEDKKAKKDKKSYTTSPSMAPAPTMLTASVTTPPTTMGLPTTLVPVMMSLATTEKPTMGPTTLAPIPFPTLLHILGPTMAIPSHAPTRRRPPATAPPPTEGRPTESAVPPTMSTTLVLDLPELTIALQQQRVEILRRRQLLVLRQHDHHERRMLVAATVPWQEFDLNAAMQDFLDEFLRGRFSSDSSSSSSPNYSSVNTTSTLDAGTGHILTTTGTATFLVATTTAAAATPPPPQPENMFLNDALWTYFEFFGKQELEEDLAEYGVASVTGIQLNGRTVEGQVDGDAVVVNNDNGEDRTSSTTTNNQSSWSGGMQRTEMILVIVASVSVVVLLITALFLLAHRVRRQRRRARELDNSSSTMDKGIVKKVLVDTTTTENEGLLKIIETQDDTDESPTHNRDVTHVAEGESENDDDDDDAASAQQYPKPVYIRPYAEKSDDDPSEYSEYMSDGDIISLASTPMMMVKPPVNMTTTITDSGEGTTEAADPSSVAKSGKGSLRSYQYDPSRLGQVISKTKQGKP